MSKILSERQKQWIERSRFIWRLAGLANPANYCNQCTEEERTKLNEAWKIIKEVQSNVTKSSEELGFKVRKRNE